MSDEGIYLTVPLIAEYYVNTTTEVTWKPWCDGPLLGYELIQGDEITRLYIDPRTAGVYVGVGIPDVDRRLDG